VTIRTANTIERLNNVRPSHVMWFENHRMCVWSRYPSQLICVRKPSWLCVWANIILRRYN